MYQKFFAAKDEAAARKAVIGMVLGVVVVETLLDTTAIFGAGVYWTDPAFHAGGGGWDERATETILLVFARHNLPVVAGCLLLSGAVAIVFSTATTFLMVPSTGFARDIFQRFIDPEVSERKLIFIQRIAIIVLAALAYLVTTRFTSILDMALYAYTIVGAAVTPALLAAFLWKRVTALGGVLSIALGTAVTILFAVLHQSGLESVDLGLFELPIDYDYIFYPAATASLLGLVVGSLVSPPPPEAAWRRFVTD